MEFTFADIGEGISEGEIVQWLVGEGDYVEENQTLLEVETDKAIVELPSPTSGHIQSKQFKTGETVEVGETLVIIEEKASSETPDLDKKDSDDTGTVVGEFSDEEAVIDDETQTMESSDEDEVLATPATRKLADDLGVELMNIDGSGSQGRITKEDVKAAAKNEDQQSTSERRKDEYGQVDVHSLRGVRKTIAQQTQESANEIPQVTHMDQGDVTDLYEFMLNKRSALDEFKLTLTPFFIKATVKTLKQHLELNSSISMDDQEIRYKQYYNLGVTVDTDEGLMVPVIKNADQKTIVEIGEELSDLANQCKNRDIDLKNLKGATFTITNIGFIGGTWATPQVNYPEVAIMATGRAEEKPVVRDEEITKRRMLPLSLSFDHRVLDGAKAAKFTNDFIKYLGKPDSFNFER